MHRRRPPAGHASQPITVASQPHRLRLPAAVVALACTAPFVAGCSSSSNLLASRSPGAILAAARRAAESASAVRVQSASYDGKSAKTPTLTLKLQLTSAGGRAVLSLLGRKSEAIRVGNTVYVKGGPAFYRRLARVTGQHLAPGTWVKAPANGSQLAESSALTERTRELGLLLRNPTISLTKGRSTVLDGKDAIELKEKGKLYTGAIYITATGTAYPLLIVTEGQESGRTTFAGWNQPTQLTPPAGAIQLGSGRP